MSVSGGKIERTEWAKASIQGLCGAIPVLLLYIYWFVIADRYFLFLYYHDMGPLALDTTPFSRITSSRYWMAGLVAGGAVLVANTFSHWLMGRLRPGYKPAAWWRAWLASAPLLLLALPAITMLANQPRLPVAHAMRTTLGALTGLALGLMPGRLAAQRPRELVLLTLDGSALALSLFGIAMIERVVGLMARGMLWSFALILAVLLASVTSLLLMTVLRHLRRWGAPQAQVLYVAGLCIAYPLMALTHHIYVGAIDGYWYISDADNFFSRSWGLQLAAFSGAGVLAAAITLLRSRLALRNESDRSLGG